MTRAENLFQKAIDLASSQVAPSMELARCVAAMHERDKQELTRFIRASKVGRRKAYFLLEIGRAVKQLRVPTKRLDRIGWTKLQIIAKQLTSENSAELLKLAEQMTAQELKRHVRGDVPTSKSHCLLLYFTPEQFTIVEKALLDHGGKPSAHGIANKEAAIINIVGHLSDVKDRLLSR